VTTGPYTKEQPEFVHSSGKTGQSSTRSAYNKNLVLWSRMFQNHYAR